MQNNSIVKSIPQELWYQCFDNIEELLKPRAITSLACVSNAFENLINTYRIQKANQGKELILLGIKNELAFAIQHNLVKIKLSAKHAITTACMEALQKLPKLQLLEIGLCLGLTDSDLKGISTLSTLSSLKLCNCWNITDLGLQHISQLSLKILNIGSRFSIFEYGNKCVNTTVDTLLKILDGSNRPITDYGLQCLSTMTGLQKLNLAYCQNISSIGLKHLSHLSNLTILNLQEADICNEKIQSLSPMVKLERLYLQGNLFSATGLSHLSALQNLKKLNLYICNNIQDAAMQHLSLLTALQNLNLGFCPIGSESLRHLTSLTGLQNLNLTKCLIEDKSLGHLTSLTNIQTLYLSSNPDLTADGIKPLSTLTSLLMLEYSECLMCRSDLKPFFPGVELLCSYDC